MLLWWKELFCLLFVLFCFLTLGNSILPMQNTEAGHLAFLCLNGYSFLSLFTFIFGFFYSRGGSILPKHSQAHLWNEVCFRIRFLNPIIYLTNTLSMAKCLVDKYWNKIILSYFEFLPTAYLEGENNWKRNTDVTGPLNGYFYKQIKSMVFDSNLAN